MNTSGKIETIGVLLKEETLQTVEHNVLENTLVLESIEPFPGYHGENIPTSIKPESLFLITDKAYPDEVIFRVSQDITCYQNIPSDAAPVEISVLNYKLSGIRLRGLTNYSIIAEIQKCYMEKDLRFMKKKTIHAPGLVRITKIFLLERLEDHIFRDLEDANTYYLDIPCHFDWDLFKRVTMNIKNNLDNSNFDCASAFIYLKDMIEFVRVYVHNPSPGRLKSIHEKYLEEIARIRDDAL